MLNSRQHSYTEALAILLIPTTYIYHFYLFAAMSLYRSDTLLDA